MKKLAVLLVGIALSAELSAQNLVQNRTALFRAAGVVMFSEPVPLTDFDFPIEFLSGAKRNLSSYKGNLVFLNFWATWCGPCRSEMPSMQTLYQRYKSRPLAVVAVNLGEEKEDVRRFMQEQNLSFPAALDEKEEAGYLFGIEAIPTSYLIDKAGRIIGGVQGSIRWDTPAIYALFDYLLGE
jgi:thiol-disulfide isomerase/thioredoxin